MAIAVLLVIIVPIIYNKVSGAFVGLLQRQAMMQPKEVVIDNPEMKKLYDTEFNWRIMENRLLEMYYQLFDDKD